MKSKKIAILDFFPELNRILEIMKWYKKEGENISREDILLVIIVDSEVFEIKSLWSGRIVKINAVKNQMISPQTVIAQIMIT